MDIVHSLKAIYSHWAASCATNCSDGSALLLLRFCAATPSRSGASSTIEDEKENNTIGGDPKIWAPTVGKVNEGISEDQ